MVETTYSLGYWIERRRKALDLTRAELAARVNCSLETIKKIERDERRPSIQVAGLLADVLGLDAAERTGFLQVIQKKRPVDSLGLTEHPLEAPPTFHHNNLPAESTRFVGRESELKEISAMLSEPNCRLLTILGTGGAGKSRLSVHAAGRVQAAFKHGVCFVALAGIDSVNAVPAAIATGLGISQPVKLVTPSNLLGYLHRKQLLLVLDNFEHLLSGTSLLTDILERAPEVKILVTSRQRLNLHSEWVYLLQGLSVPPPDESGSEEAYSSMHLFVESVQRIKPGYQLDERNLPDVARICRHVQGMPLAIELAAAWIPVMEPGEIANEIERGLDILEADLGDLPARQRSMRAVFDSSWRLLTDEEQQAIEMLASFRGGFTLQTAREIFDLPNRLILSLVNKCWVQPGSGGRFDLHELIRQYAFEKLQVDRDRAAWCAERHSTYFCNVLHRHEGNWFTSREGEAIREVEAEFQNIDAAWNWALQQQRLDLVVSAAESLSCYYNLYLRFAERNAAMHAALECMRAGEGNAGVNPQSLQLARVRARIDLLDEVGTRDGLWKELENLRVLLDQLEHDGCDTRRELAHLMGWESHLMVRDNPARSFEIQCQIASLYRDLGSELLEIGMTASIADDYAGLGHFQQALRMAKQCLETSRKAGYPGLVSGNLELMGRIYREIGEIELAEQCGRESLEEQKKLGLRVGNGFTDLYLSVTLMQAGKFDEALAHARTSLETFDWLGTGHDHSGAAHIVMALMLLHQGAYEQAKRNIDHCHGELDQITDARVMGVIFDVTGAYHLAHQQWEQSMQNFSRSLEIMQRARLSSMSGIPRAHLAYAYLGANLLPEAERHLDECLLEAVRMGSFTFAIQALPAMALYLACVGDAVRAVEVYTLAAQRDYVARSAWFEEVAGRQMKLLADQLPPGSLEAARARGESLNVLEVARGWLAERGHALPENPPITLPC